MSCTCLPCGCVGRVIVAQFASYINYPIREDLMGTPSLKTFVDLCHTQGLNVKLYVQCKAGRKSAVARARWNAQGCVGGREGFLKKGFGLLVLSGTSPREN